MYIRSLAIINWRIVHDGQIDEYNMWEICFVWSKNYNTNLIESYFWRRAHLSTYMDELILKYFYICWSIIERALHVHAD